MSCDNQVSASLLPSLFQQPQSIAEMTPLTKFWPRPPKFSLHLLQEIRMPKTLYPRTLKESKLARSIDIIKSSTSHYFQEQ